MSLILNVFLLSGQGDGQVFERVIMTDEPRARVNAPAPQRLSESTLCLALH